MAIDAGSNLAALDESGTPLTADQRGFVRIADGDRDSTATVDMGAFEAIPSPVLVDTLADEDDGPGVGAGTSLREAIQVANSIGDLTCIQFTVAGTITLVTPLPSFTAPVEIDGSTAPGFVTGGLPVVGIDGGVASAPHGLDLFGPTAAPSAPSAFARWRATGSACPA